ncbi:hypothetical protein [Panacagrimonas sp.]|uniref:hypothetical protein n=1 Tax=Panacagrimonas sp. TaxID=2480088 RepID=UPI003B522BE9
MTRTVVVAIAGLLAATSGTASADSDAVRKALQDRAGKSATVVLASGAELTGKVGALSDDSVRLTELSGKEFFDAVIDLDHVQAVVFRARDN